MRCRDHERKPRDVISAREWLVEREEREKEKKKTGLELTGIAREVSERGAKRSGAVRRAFNFE